MKLPVHLPLSFLLAFLAALSLLVVATSEPQHLQVADHFQPRVTCC